MPATAKIGFRPGLLDERPHRFDLVLIEPGVALIDKPAGLSSTDRLTRSPGPNLSAAIAQQAREEKPELERLGFSGCTLPYELDREFSGWVLAVGDPARVGLWREHHGSGNLCFEVLMITPRNPALPDQCDCDLPVVPPTPDRRASISHQNGKRTATRFQRLAVAGDFECWKASTRFWRPQALRLHALESGLPILGDSLFGRRSGFSLQAYRRKQAPRRDFGPSFFSQLHAHLFRVEWKRDAEADPQAAVSLPRGRLEVVFRTLFGKSFLQRLIPNPSPSGTETSAEDGERP
jgi:23S rRNA-/tRNA-specific pseudouridylate synthase